MNRRAFRRGGLAGGVMVFAASCGGSGESSHGGSSGDDHGGSGPATSAASSRTPLNANLARVEWPAFVTDAGGDVRELYEFQLSHGELMQYIPCFCGCGRTDGHRSNRDCFVQQVNADGSAVLDEMAPT